MALLDFIRRVSDPNTPVPSASPAAGSPAPLALPVTDGRQAGRAADPAAGLLELTSIVPDPAQPREHFDPEAMARLTASIRTRGILQPLRVRWEAGLGKYVLLVGERRYRAALAAGLVRVPVQFVQGMLNESDRLEEQLIENLQREDLGALEQARAFARLMDRKGWRAIELAQRLELAPSTVSRSIALLKLPEDLQALIPEQLSPRAAYELSRLETVEEQRDLAARIQTEALTPREVGAFATGKKTGKPAAAFATGKKRGKQTVEEPARPKGTVNRYEVPGWPGSSVIVTLGLPVVHTADVVHALRTVVAALEFEPLAPPAGAADPAAAIFATGKNTEAGVEAFPEAA